jgi:hypothetical protein
LQHFWRVHLYRERCQHGSPCTSKARDAFELPRRHFGDNQAVDGKTLELLDLPDVARETCQIALNQRDHGTGNGGEPPELYSFIDMNFCSSRNP